MPSHVVQSIAWVVVLFVTLFALISLIRGVAHLWREIAGGAPEGGRWTHPWRRVGHMLGTALGHTEFRGRPVVRAAHWFVMVSFPILFLTLVQGYVQVRNPAWELPLLGHFAPWNWLVEIFAWGGTIGIIALMVVRARSGRGTSAEASLSSDSPASIDEGGAAAHPRDGSPQGPASRFLGSTRWQALFVEWVILLVCVCVIVLRGLENALTDGSAVNFPLTGWLGSLLSGMSADALATWIVLFSCLKIVVSMIWMMVVGASTSMGVAWHRFLAPINLVARRDDHGGKALGAAKPMLVHGEPLTDIDALDEDEDVQLGVGTTADLTWKARLDLYTCTECGRCQELCPAWNTQKPLSPKLMILALRDHVESASKMELTEVDAETIANADADRLVEKGLDPLPHSFDILNALKDSGFAADTGVAPVAGPLVPDVMSEEALWDCTMCGACVGQCPVDIEHVDHILDMRRHQVLMESAFPKELGRAFRGMETKQTPYNQAARKRQDWMKGLDFDVPVIGQDIEDASEVDYLFWVGCAGAYDDKAKVTTRAVAELLDTAGVSFGVLGSGESCTGDPARRAGNEVLFQMLASAAIETLTEAKAQKIVVSCAHCFNTIANEFPQLGGRFDVIHHTQLLNRLVRDGKLTPVAPPADEARTVTYHDPCFLGRHNKVYEAPRELLGAAVGATATVEMPRNHERAMCCGAGGARAWMEETRGVRIADARVAEAEGVGAEVIATACPFCSQMLDASNPAAAPQGIREGDADRPKPEVRDVAVMLLESVRRGQES